MPSKVVVNKAKLRSVLGKNKKKHRQIFEAACDGYRDKAMELLEQRVAEIKAGKVIHLAFSLPVPEDHTPDYERALKMLEMEVNDTIELDENEFAELVMDDWQWKRQWITTNSMYTSMATK